MVIHDLSFIIFVPIDFKQDHIYSLFNKMVVDMMVETSYRREIDV